MTKFLSLIISVFAFMAFLEPHHRAQAADKAKDYYPILDGVDQELSPKQIFQTVDTNKDGKIDRAEFDNRKMKVFYLKDKNKDLKLSREEFKSISDEHFKAADLNGDGKISGYEFNQAFWAKFEHFDANSDGFISYEEFLAFRKRTSK